MAEPLAGMLPFHPPSRTLTCVPVWVKAPFQPLVTRWLPANPQPRVHPLSGSPSFFIVTSAVKPVFH